MKSSAIIFFSIVITIILWSLSSCANQIALTGGPRDEIAPALDTSLSFKDQQTNFTKQKINLFFDEFINLQNASKQVVVSPPLVYIPLIKSRGKQVNFDFDDEEELKTEATYVINFGESIKDYTEGNILENFTLVFSTGDYIDSLSIKGTIKDAKTQKPAEGYLVMLYESNFDSIVYQEKPFYFAKSNKSGLFEIKNLRADTFKLFVLNDKNLNYLYDPESEEIGYIENPISLTDSTDFNVTIESFKELTPPRFIGYDVINKGKITLEFDQMPEISKLQPIDSVDLDYYFSKNGDNKLDFWYDLLSLSKINIAFNRKDNINDTISMRINLKSTADLDTVLTLEARFPKASLGHHPNKDIKIKTNYPISTFDNELIIAVDTTLQDTLDLLMTLDSLDKTLLYISGDWKEKSFIDIIFLPDAVSDLWKHTNDTTELSTTIAEFTDYGTIEITFSNIPVDTNYYVELLYNSKTLEEFSISRDTTLLLPEMEPGDYSLNIVEDINSNGKWDPGNYLQKKQSEKIFENIPMEKLRENWILSETIDILELKYNRDDPEN